MKFGWNAVEIRVKCGWNLGEIRWNSVEIRVKFGWNLDGIWVKNTFYSEEIDDSLFGSFPFFVFGFFQISSFKLLNMCFQLSFIRKDIHRMFCSAIDKWSTWMRKPNFRSTNHTWSTVRWSNLKSNFYLWSGLPRTPTSPQSLVRPVSDLSFFILYLILFKYVFFSYFLLILYSIHFLD